MSFLVIGKFRLSSIIYPLLWVGIPVFSYLLLPKKKSVLLATLIVLLAIPYFAVTFFSMLRHVICGYSDMRYEYVNKKNNKVKLVGRDFSCYGTNNDLILYKEFSITENVKFQIYYKTFVDYKNIDIDTTVWKSVR